MYHIRHALQCSQPCTPRSNQGVCGGSRAQCCSEMTSLRAAAEITGANFAFDRVTPDDRPAACSMGNCCNKRPGQ